MEMHNNKKNVINAFKWRTNDSHKCSLVDYEDNAHAKSMTDML